MAHETPTIDAQPRDRTGSRYAQRLRKQGRLPAVIYGHQTAPVSVSLDEHEMLGLLHHGAHVMNISIAGAQKETCLVKDLQYGYLGDNVIHVDFTRVDLNEEVEVNIHLHFVGEPELAKKPGAVLSTDINEVEVRCRVSDIPEEIRVDLSKFESTVTIGDLQLPAGLTATLPDSTPICHVSFVHAEEAEGEEVEVEAEAAEPEVISEADETEPEDEDESKES